MSTKPISSKPKTLLVEYAPRGSESRTRKLRQYFTDLIQDKTDITEVNLCADLPELYDQEKLNLYYKRNYLRRKLSLEETKKLAKMDAYRDQLMQSDFLILSSPMYNFGYPAPVKAWIDSAMQKQYVYTTNGQGHVPLLKHLKALVIYTSGLVYDQISENEHWNGLLAEGPRLLEYMGANEVRVVHIMGMDMLPRENILYRTKNVAHVKLTNLAKNWFNKE